MLKMMKGKVVLLMLPFVFFLNANGVMAQDDRVTGQKGCVVPTVTGNVDKPEGWNSPRIFKSSEEVDRNNFVKVWVDSEGWARPPYSWSVSGTGFHFGSVSGPTTATTDEDLEELELWADDTACGGGTVTVTDVCDNTGTDYIRCTAGQWVEISTNCDYPGTATQHFTTNGLAYPNTIYYFWKTVGKYFQRSDYHCYYSSGTAGYPYDCFSCPPASGGCDDTECVEFYCTIGTGGIKCDAGQNCITCLHDCNGGGGCNCRACYTYVGSKLYEWQCVP